MSITTTLSIAAQALQADQLALQTTGHNLANASTPGYSRQRVDLTSAFPSFSAGVSLGQGVKVTGIQRIVDHFAEGELLTLNANVGFSDGQSQALASVQDIFPVTGGIDTALSGFFAALSDLANNPSGTTERVSVIGKAQALGTSLAQTRQSLVTVQQNLDGDLKSAADKVNTLVQQIAALNREISSTEVKGESANDFRDQRQSLLQQLTNLTGATVREGADGQVTAVVSGLMLVSGDRYASLHADSLNTAGLHALTYEGADGLSFDASSLLTQGKIGAVLAMRDITVQAAIDRLDLFAQTLVQQINSQHSAGFDLTGNPGGDFFAPLTIMAGAAANVRVSDAVIADPRLIAAAGSADTVPGDNRNALALVDLQLQTIPALGGMTLQDNFLSLVGDIGSQASIAQNQLEFGQSLLTQAQTRRESVSGVNVDEEMTRLIQFQRAFESSSLLVRTADQMYESLIQMVQ